MKTYPIAEYPTSEERQKFGIKTIHFWKTTFVVRLTGEFRKPKTGDWFISGAKIEGHRAKNDLTTAYNIARLELASSVDKFCPYCNAKQGEPI